MELVATPPEHQGRKRRRKDVQNAALCTRAKRRALETKAKTLVGGYVKKDFEGSGVFLGKIVSYEDGLYRVDYEDGDCEDLDSAELKDYLFEVGDLSKDLIKRKDKLDELVAKKDAKWRVLVGGAKKDTVNDVKRVEESNGGACKIDPVESNDDGDLSSDGQDEDLNPVVDVPVRPPPPLLPPSSGNIGVPEEYVSYLLSVYSFLRSFSVQLFLSPFGLDDFVGSLNCSVPNTLLDAVHLALMRVVKRHLEFPPPDCSELASKCLRFIDWSLLDALTWPVYLVQYLMIMGHLSGPQWKGFYVDALERDYYALPTGWKLMILQVLCDDVLDSSELRSDIDDREESEVGTESDAVAAVVSENGPRRVHPRYSKTSACKSEESLGIITGIHGTKPFNNSGHLGIKGTNVNEDSDDVHDGNSDECRLCRNDGVLLCCDGCPSAYHSRCIGVSKVFIPDGPWYCPECAANRNGLTIVKGTSLTGGELFGVDSYGNLFLGTCSHLLVMKVSTESEQCFRYYNLNDIPKVLQVLLSSTHVMMYLDVCKAILRYWYIQKDTVIHILGKVGMYEQLANEKDNGQYSLPIDMLGEESHKLIDLAKDKNLGGGFIAEDCAENVGSLHLESSSKESLFNKPLLDMKSETEYSYQKENSGAMTMQVSHSRSSELPEWPRENCIPPSGLMIQQVSSSDLTCGESERNSSVNLACSSGRTNGIHRGLVDILFDSKEEIKQAVGSGNRHLSDHCLYMGLHFKPLAYLNNYIQGDFAASASTSLSILTSEEKEVIESNSSDKRRKVALADNLLQVKAFSTAAVRFFWPNTEKKLVEVPRERCGWCLSCKAPVASKRGCLLNAAASNAIKNAMKILAGLSLKNREGSLCAIASYMIFMEESLCGLIVGNFRTTKYRKLWCKRVEQAMSCNSIKPLLLELEENIRAVAISPDWFKLVDSWSVESSVAQSTIITSGSTQKRSVSGRRGRKPAAVSETTSDDHTDDSTDFQWWRGGIFSKLILQRGVLPCAIVKKAARQGGCRKIPGVVYVEGSEIPKRSRQYFWRAAVEMSKNASELALQVRRLDHYLRWGDLVRPEQNVQDGKGQDSEASAFRNAFVCDKKIMEDKISYGVAFGSQKHLPSRVMKNIIDVEQIQDGREKYWFSEKRIPVYLIKEYEEKVDKVQSMPENPANVLSTLQKRQLKASRKDIFSYLSCKSDNLDKCGCASCQLDVLIRFAVKCSGCEGFCHERCTIGSTNHNDGKVEYLLTCKLCQMKNIPQNENSNESPTSPLLFQGQDLQNAVTARKGLKLKIINQPLTPAGHVHSSLETNSATRNSGSAAKERSKIRHWGLIMKKNKEGKSQEEKRKEDEEGYTFRTRYILGKSTSDGISDGPKCHLCDQPYNPGLMYILCGTCLNWYHTEALELEESKLPDVVGFKCCRCRRIKSPTCPYMDLSKKKPLEPKKLRTRGTKGETSESDTPVLSDQHLNELEKASLLLPLNDEFPCTPGDDPLLYSLMMAEQFSEHNTEMDAQWNSAASASRTVPQKLPVRRLVNNDKTLEVSTATEQGISVNQAYDFSSSPCIEWDISGNATEDGIPFDCDGLNFEDMEFEPQTYFSFNELLASDEGARVDEANACTDDFGITFDDDFGNTYGDIQNGFPEELVMDDSTGQECNIPVDTCGDIIYCQQCSHADPIPELCCQICGIKIHLHCSPWVEQPPLEGHWRCGNCREWR